MPHSISALVGRGRGAMLDFLPEPDAARLAELIVAFSNNMGGTVIVGMDEKGRMAGDATEYMEPLLQRALGMCRPLFTNLNGPQWEATEIPEGRVVIVSIKPAELRVALEGGEVLVRSGKENRRLNAEEVARGRGSSRRAVSFEEETHPDARRADLDEAIIAEYRENRRKRHPHESFDSDEELLREAGAIDARGVPTAAGLLLFGKAPQRFYSQVGVVGLHFAGQRIAQGAAAATALYAYREEVVGPLARQVTQAEQLLMRLMRHTPQMYGFRREEVYEYPLQAVREAVVNAIVHRDYTIEGQRVEIRLYDDGLQIMSPGGLPGHITLENMRQEHYSRNPRLVRGLLYWGYSEELGRGIDIMYEVMECEHHPAPDFRDTGRNFTAVLYNVVSQAEVQFGEQLNSRQVQLVRFLATHEAITNSQYQELCPDVTSETLRLDLRDLVEKGILLKIGDKRGTKYTRK
jgi:ATP-dependent DNA helicase RecG